ncbi:MAG: hypothetical protein ACE5KT_11915 [Methanosarcinales archaeon]
MELIKELHEIKSMISDLSNLMLKGFDMEIEPVFEDELTKEEKEDIERILSGKEKLMNKEEFEKYIDL